MKIVLIIIGSATLLIIILLACAWRWHSNRELESLIAATEGRDAIAARELIRRGYITKAQVPWLEDESNQTAT